MSSKKTSLSIAMACFNGEEMISMQLKSILDQTYQDFVLLICDDNSSDNTVEVIQQYMKDDSRIILYQNQYTLGYVKNFEKVISLCTTEYIALSDQDDIWRVDKLEKEMLLMHSTEKENASLPIMIHSDLSMYSHGKKCITYPSYFHYRGYVLNESKDLGHLLGPCGVMGNTILFNCYLKERILPFPEKLENHDYWIALINELFGKRVTIHEPLVSYRIHSSNTSYTSFSRKPLTRSLKKWFVGDVTLPYINSKRAFVLAKLLQKYNLKANDKIIITAFLKYLHQEDTKLMQIYNVFRYSFVKKGLRNKTKIIFKILIRKRK